MSDNSIIPFDLMNFVVDYGNRPYVQGQQIVMRFPNNYGVSIVRNSISYGHERGLFEIAVITFKSANNDEWEITYNTPITGDVLGWQSVSDVLSVIHAVMAL